RARWMAANRLRPSATRPPASARSRASGRRPTSNAATRRASGRRGRFSSTSRRPSSRSAPARAALTTPNYAAQSFDQDKWMARESGLDGPAALNAFLALAAMNLALFASLSPADRETPLTHPEYGAP